MTTRPNTLLWNNIPTSAKSVGITFLILTALFVFGFRIDDISAVSYPSSQPRIYDYRVLSACYASSCVLNIIGEIYLPNHDSLKIVFRDPHQEPGLDTTLTFINSTSRTKAFRVYDSTIISLWRSVFTHWRDTTLQDLSLPDTCSWAISLYNAANDTRIGVLDSIVLYPRLTGLDFPEMDGDSVGFTMITFHLNILQMEGVDSAYMTFRMYKKGNGVPTFNMSDSRMFNSKFSEKEEFNILEKKSFQPNHTIISDNVEISVYPNPLVREAVIKVKLLDELDFTLNLCSMDGKIITRIFQGKRSSGAYQFRFTPSTILASGAYVVTLTDQNARTQISKNIFFLK